MVRNKAAEPRAGRARADTAPKIEDRNPVAGSRGLSFGNRRNRIRNRNRLDTTEESDRTILPSLIRTGHRIDTTFCMANDMADGVDRTGRTSGTRSVRFDWDRLVFGCLRSEADTRNGSNPVPGNRKPLVLNEMQWSHGQRSRSGWRNLNGLKRHANHRAAPRLGVPVPRVSTQLPRTASCRYGTPMRVARLYSFRAH